MALALTVTVEPVKAAAVLHVTGGGGSKLTLWRIGPSGAVAYVRGYAPPGPNATTVNVRDYEVPLGVPVGYYAARTDPGGTIVEQIGPVPFELDAPADSDPWLVDLSRPLGSFQTLVEALPSQRHDTPAGVHRVLGRRTPIVTSELAWTWQAELRFVTHTPEQEQAALTLLGSGVPFLMRTPPSQGVGSVYVFPVGFSDERVSRIALHPDRRFVVEAVQVDRPDPSLFVPTPPADYAGVKATYATYADLLASGQTYDALLYNYAAGTPPVAGWPPVDV